MSGASILPDPHQIQAADPSRSVFVTANAGSGKTSTLVDRVARLLLEDVEPGEILCVTYTKAAAAEMQSRLFERLGEWSVMDDAGLERSLADLRGQEIRQLGHDALSRARSLFAKALETPGGLKIQTLHAFCEKLLRRFPVEAGVSPRFKVLEDQAAIVLSHAAREDLARAALADPDGLVGQAYSHFAVELDWESFNKLLAMLESERAALADYVARIEQGASPDPYALVGADPETTVAQLEATFVRSVDRQTWLSTAEAMATGSKTDQDCADRMWSADWTFHAILSVFLTTSGEPRKSMATKSAPASAKAWLEELQLKALAAQQVLRAQRIAESTRHVLTLARAHAAFYEQAKDRSGALDFSDLVARTVELLTVRSSAAWVLFKLDGGLEHILVDEAQDTAPAQWDILKALTESFFSGEGAREDRGARMDRTIFAVGDEKQSIYSFQGARPERLAIEAQTYDERVRGAGGEFEGVPLEVSFRSTETVLAFVDTAFDTPERSRALTGRALQTRGRHKANRKGDPGSVELWPLYRDEKIDPPEAWEPVDAEPVESARKRMARDIAREIRRQVMAGAAVQDKRTRQPRPAGYGDFLILVRRRDATFEEIIRALKAEGVPVAGADRLKLSSHIVLDDLLSVARFALFPDDDLSLAEVLRGPLCDVDEEGLYELAGANPDRRKLWRELRDRHAERPDWTHAHDLLRFAVQQRARDPFGFFSALLNRVDGTGRSGRARILARLGREAEEAIDETLNQVLAAEDRGAHDLERCLAELEQADVEVKRELEGPRGEVRVMTVHGAKGLEAPVVILPDTTSRAKAQGPTLLTVEAAGGEAWLMAPGAAGEDCPASADARAARQARVDDETLRLLYVALTRARDRIIITGRANGQSKTGFAEGSWWDVLSGTMTVLGARHIDEDRLRFGDDPTFVAHVAGPTATPSVARPEWLDRPATPDLGARIASPSQMDGQAKAAALSPLAAAQVGSSLGRFRRGDLIHRLLERLPDIAPDARTAAAERLLSRERDLTDEQRAEMIAAAFSVLDDARFGPVFGPGSRPEVALTGSAPDLPAGTAINGRLDRLVITPERVLVVDYKTNRPAPARIEDADEAYVLQMAVYVAVLRRLYPDRPVEAALVWTDGPALMPVPPAMIDEALARLGT